MKQLLLASALLLFPMLVPAQSVTVADAAPEQARDLRIDGKGTASDRLCVQQTGSRITEMRNSRSTDPEKDCVLSGGRVYTREDIRNTGEFDLAGALRKLDPSIR
jgi:hypothetical protein